jgi:heavy metal translocating P-type ATPase
MDPQVITAPSLDTPSHLGEVRNAAPLHCLHCGRSNPEPEKSSFCCQGCAAVFEILNERGLAKSYYQLKRSGVSVRGRVPAALPAESYDYLDDPKIQGESFEPGAGSGTHRCLQFYLEGVHCVACVWLTEKIGDFVPHVKSVRLDLGNSVATVVLDEKGKFSEVATEFARLGYRPHFLKQGESERHQKRENRLQLIRLAVAGAATGNIMLMSVPLYTGLTGSFAELFRWLSFIIFLPVGFFSAWPFYQSALGALRSGQVSIDIPIVLGILLGAGASTYNLISGSPHIYFDSLAPLVFLLLASRYALRRAQQMALNSTRLVQFLTPSWVRRWDGQRGGFARVALDEAKVGDLIEVLPNELIPVDGVVSRGISTLNSSLLTGESLPTPVSVGGGVFAGTQNLDAPLEIKVTATGLSSRLGRILKQMEESLTAKAPIVAAADRASRYFVMAVVAVVTGVFLWWLPQDFNEALNRALALAIVTCPCALALATPLAVTQTLGRCARAGILIKGGDVLEKLARIKRIFLDKTGTLTNGCFEVLSWGPVPAVLDGPTQAEPHEQSEVRRDEQPLEPLDAHRVRINNLDLKGIFLALESQSVHPIARAFLNAFSDRLKEGPLPKVTDFKETLGVGVSGRIGSYRYEISQWKGSIKEDGQGLTDSEGGTRVALFEEGHRIAHAVLGDRLRADSQSAVERLRVAGLELRILSGDSRGAVRAVAEALGFQWDEWFAEVSPEKKAELVGAEPRAVMVGDGANDAVALARAYVGIAVHGGMEIAMRAADAYHSNPGVMPVYHGVLASRETMRVIYRNFAFSFLYNIVGATAAILGWMTPLAAALLMPASALTVYLSSLVGTRRLRAVLSEAERRGNS